MAIVTLQVVNGLERGRTFSNLQTPVTVGREDENSVRLNDERVSRFHAKIQEDGTRFILTDLDSTNGTRVNGHPTAMRVLQFGDQLAFGRTLMVFGSPADLKAAQHEKGERGHDIPADGTIALNRNPDDDMDDVEVIEELFPGGPPELPKELKPLQKAQVSDILAFIHHQMGVVLEEAESESESPFAPMRVDWETWQRMLQIEMALARYLREIADPTA